MLLSAEKRFGWKGACLAQPPLRLEADDAELGFLARRVHQLGERLRQASQTGEIVPGLCSLWPVRHAAE